MTGLLLVPLLAVLTATAPPSPTGLTTLAEQSGFARTGRYEEVVRLCTAFATSYPRQVRCTRFGTTPEGRPLLALAASADGTLDGRSVRERARPVVLFQGGIHAGEIDGKDAGFILLRDLLAGRRLPGVLSLVTAVFVPVFNVDGHERFGRHNRPNQIGPEEMGWRVTAQNLNLNRDYVKADTPEMAAMLRLLAEWDPLVYADLHVTDGANFEHDVAVMIDPRHAGPERLRGLAGGLLDELLQKLTAGRHLPLGFYPSFEKDDDPASGFGVSVAPPRFSTGYWALHNRFAVLVETHSWKDYRTRVRATIDTVAGLLSLTAAHGAAWLEAAHAADRDDERLAGASVPLLYEHTARATRIQFRGYAYTVEPSPVSGALRIRYDPRRPQRWDVPFYPEVQPVAVAQAPGAGYVVPAAQAPLVGDKLRLHGLSFVVLDKERQAEVEAFRITEKKFRSEPYEGRQTVQVKGAWHPEVRRVPAGSLFVPIGQRGGRLLVHLLDPGGPDSLLSWGFFNAALEQKEFMESYVAEAVAQEMLARDPGLRAEFSRKLAADPEFRKSPEARLRFFHQRHPSWDERYDLYPVYRVKQRPDQRD